MWVPGSAALLWPHRRRSIVSFLLLALLLLLIMMKVRIRIYRADKCEGERKTARLPAFFCPPLWLTVKNNLYLSLVQPITSPALPWKQGGKKISWFQLCPSSFILKTVFFCGTCKVALASEKKMQLWKCSLSRQDGNPSTSTNFLADALQLRPVLRKICACTLVTGRNWESRAWSKASFAVIDNTVQAKTVTGVLQSMPCSSGLQCLHVWVGTGL